MSATKCSKCGLVNFATASSCKRCKQLLATASPTAMAPPADQRSPSVVTAARPSERLTSSGTDPVDLGFRREGSLLVMTTDSVLPGRCVRCNAPATEQLQRNLEWCPKFVWVFGFSVPMIRTLLYFFGYGAGPRYAEAVAFFFPVIGIALYYWIRETASIHIGLCDSHMNRRLFGMWVGGGLMVLGFLIGFIAVFNHDYWMLLYGGIAVIVGAFPLVILTPTVTAHRIEQPYIWVKGMDSSFLDSLPSFLNSLPQTIL
jgi:hypothetical protein